MTIKTTINRLMLVFMLGMAGVLAVGGISACGKTIRFGRGVFPDTDFEMYVRYTFDSNHDGKLSDAERKAVKEIDIGDASVYQLEWEYNPALSVEGVEYFPNLEKLNCSYNAIKKLDVSKLKNLRELRCGHNLISKLDVSKNKKLKTLICNGNRIKKLDVSKNVNLEVLYCGENKIKKIDISRNKKLKGLSVRHSKLHSINIKNQKNLEELYCRDNKIKKLNLKYNKKLTVLECQENQIEKLELSHLGRLNYLYCSNNRLTELNLRGNPLLELFYCDNNCLVSGNRNISYTQFLDDINNVWTTFSPQKRTMEVKKIGKYYYVPIRNFNRTNAVTNLSEGKITDKGIKLTGKKLPEKITYEYNMFNDGDQKTKVTIKVRKPKKQIKKKKGKKKK